MEGGDEHKMGKKKIFLLSWLLSLMSRDYVRIILALLLHVYLKMVWKVIRVQDPRFHLPSHSTPKSQAHHSPEMIQLPQLNSRPPGNARALVWLACHSTGRILSKGLLFSPPGTLGKGLGGVVLLRQRGTSSLGPSPGGAWAESQPEFHSAAAASLADRPPGPPLLRSDYSPQFWPVGGPMSEMLTRFSKHVPKVANEGILGGRRSMSRICVAGLGWDEMGDSSLQPRNVWYFHPKSWPTPLFPPHLCPQSADVWWMWAQKAWPHLPSLFTWKAAFGTEYLCQNGLNLVWS